MMHIYYISRIIYEHNNAELVHTTELFKNMKKTGNRVSLFVYSKNKNSKNNNDLIVIPTINKKILWAFLGEFFLIFYLMHQIIATGKPEVIYTRLTRNSIVPLIFSKVLRIPFIIEVNGLLIEEMQLFKRSKWEIWLAKKLINLNYKKADRIIAVTEGTKKGIIETIKIDHDKIVVINNGANTDLFKPMDQKNIQKELGLAGNYQYVCFVGNFTPWQGLHNLVDSASYVLKTDSKIKYLVVGEGPLKNSITKLTRERGFSNDFIFIGPVSYENVPNYINASDVCVVPKTPLKSGYSPLKLYEYMACGKPIIASNLPGFEILERNKAGFLVEPGDNEQLAESILKLLKDGETKKEMGENARKYVVNNHNWENISKEIVKTFKDAITSKLDSAI
jgi:glycosyltransferase involved in cell wall biosynthesis